MINKQMFENTILAILKASPGLGSIQIRKALCISDAVHNFFFGQGITGVKYIKEKRGPVPDREGYELLQDMAFAGKIEIVEEPVGVYTQNSHYAISEPDYSMFSRDQIDIINHSARIARTHSATLLSFKTHDAVYDGIKMQEEIPLKAICSPVITGYDTEPFTEEERSDMRKFLESNKDRLFAFG